MTGPRRFVIETAWRGRRRILPAVLLTGMHQLCEIAVPVVVGIAIDRGIVGADPVQLALWLGVLVVVFLVLASSYRAGSLIALRGVEEVGHGLRMRVSRRILDARGFGDRPRAAGELLGIGGSDVRAVSGGLMLFVYPFAELAAVVAAGVVLFGIAWPLGLAVVAGGPVFLIVLDRLSGALRQRVETQQQRTADSATLAADAIAGYRTLSALGATERASARYREASEIARGAALAARRTESVFVAATSAATGLFVVSIGIAAALMALGGTLTIGELITTVGVVQVVMGPLEALSVNVGTVWAWAAASGKRVLSVLDAPFTRQANAEPVVDEGMPGLRIRSVAGIDVHVPPGRIVGVVADGSTAAGLVDQLGGRAPVDDGALLVDGTDLSAVPATERPAHITVAPHAAHVIEGTVGDNVGGDTSRALEAAAFADVLASLPDGVSTHLNPSGRSLSGGQRQRLALARAFAASAPVLVLHDPTTAIDAVTELDIAERLRAATRDRATLLVCTSPQLLSRADRVVLLRNGEVVADGTHAELLSTRPDYAEAVS